MSDTMFFHPLGSLFFFVETPDMLFRSRKEVFNHGANNLVVSSGSFDQGFDLGLGLLRIVRDLVARSQDGQHSMQMHEDSGKKYPNSFKSKYVDEGNLALEVTYSPVDSGNVSANISHVAEKWPNNFHKNIGPSLFVAGSCIFNAREGIMYG